MRIPGNNFTYDIKRVYSAVEKYLGRINIPYSFPTQPHAIMHVIPRRIVCPVEIVLLLELKYIQTK